MHYIAAQGVYKKLGLLNLTYDRLIASWLPRLRGTIEGALR